MIPIKIPRSQLKDNIAERCLNRIATAILPENNLESKAFHQENNLNCLKKVT